MIKSTYNPSVRIGNWAEDIRLQEDILKDFLDKRDRGELLIQNSNKLGALLIEQVDLTVSRDGFVRIGDTVCLGCRRNEDRLFVDGIPPRDDSCLSLNIINPNELSQKTVGDTGIVSGTKLTSPMLRSAFIIRSSDPLVEDGSVLKYGQAFQLCTLEGAGSLYLRSDLETFHQRAKKSRHQNVCLELDNTSYQTQWMVKCYNPCLRMEYEYAPVRANEECVITHCKTNCNLTIEDRYLLSTAFHPGREYEVSCHNYMDGHRAEEGVNRWIITMGVPGGANKINDDNNSSNITSETATQPPAECEQQQS